MKAFARFIGRMGGFAALIGTAALITGARVPLVAMLFVGLGLLAVVLAFIGHTVQWEHRSARGWHAEWDARPVEADLEPAGVES